MRTIVFIVERSMRYRKIVSNSFDDDNDHDHDDDDDYNDEERSLSRGNVRIEFSSVSSVPCRIIASCKFFQQTDEERQCVVTIIEHVTRR